MDELDKAISRAQRNAKAKIRRLRAKRYDAVKHGDSPLRDPSGMTRKQKTVYLGQLNRFTSRANVFYVDANGNRISARVWNAYKKAEAEANAFVRKDIAKYAKLYGPEGSRGMTLAQKIDIMRAKPGRLMVNPSGSSMHEIHRKPTAFNSEASVKKMLQTLRDKPTPRYQGKKLRSGRKQFETMAKMLGDKEMLKAVKGLTDEQFKVLWNYTDFATAVSLKYTVYMQSLVAERSFHAAAMEAADNKAMVYIAWASKI